MARELSPFEELCHKLDELGVEYDTYELPNGNHGVSWIDGNDIEWEAVPLGENFEIHALQLVTPEQAIAATVGADLNTREAIRKLLDKLNTELCNAGCVVKCKTREERQGLIDAVKDKYAQAIAATVSNRSCASCPEMDNPDSYIVHLHRALEVANEGAGTCRKEDDCTCENVSGKWWEFKCSRCGYEVDESPEDLYNSCPCCGSTIAKEETE